MARRRACKGMTERVAAKPAELRRDPPMTMRFPRWQDRPGAGRETSGRLDQAQLLEYRHAVVEADLFRDQAVNDLDNGGAGEPHRLAAAGG